MDQVKPLLLMEKL